MMYYTDATSNQQLSITCGGNQYPHDFDGLPADNDVQLPPNPALEEQAANPNAPHAHTYAGHMHRDDMQKQSPLGGEGVTAAGNKHAGNREGSYDDGSFTNKLYNEVVARRGGSAKGGAGGSRYLLNNYYDYSIYGNNRPYKDYYDYYDVGNQRSRNRNRYGNQRNGGNAGTKASNTARAFFPFDNADDNRAWGWQQQPDHRPSQGGGGTAAMGGPPRLSSNGEKEGVKTSYNLQSQNPYNQFLPRQRAGVTRPEQAKPAPLIKQQSAVPANTNQQEIHNTKQQAHNARKGGPSPPPSKLYTNMSVICVSPSNLLLL